MTRDTDDNLRDAFMAVRAAYRAGAVQAADAKADEFIARFEQDPALQTREYVARAKIKKAYSLTERGAHERALDLYDDVVGRNAAGESRTLDDVVAIALNNKGAELAELGRYDEAALTCSRLIELFADDADESISKSVARGCISRAYALVQLGRDDEAIASYDVLLDRYADSPAAGLRASVAEAFGYKAELLKRRDDLPGAARLWSELADRFDGATEPAIREHVAHALVMSGWAFEHLRQRDRALAAYDRLLSQHSTEEHPDTQKAIAFAGQRRAVLTTSAQQAGPAATFGQAVLRRAQRIRLGGR